MLAPIAVSAYVSAKEGLTVTLDTRHGQEFEVSVEAQYISIHATVGGFCRDTLHLTIPYGCTEVFCKAMIDALQGILDASKTEEGGAP